MKLKKYLYIVLIALLGMTYTSCENIGLSALEKPDSEDVTIDTMFGNREYAERVLWNAYRSLRMGLPRNPESTNIGRQLQSDITDLSHNFMTWGGVVEDYYSGALSPSNVVTDDSHPSHWLAPLAVLPYGDYPSKGV